MNPNRPITSLRTGALAAALAIAPLDLTCRPNVLMIVSDDLNDWIGCLGGHPQALTPNIDRLAARGVLFSSAHCQAPLCNPSRTSLMTGRRPSSTGVYGLTPWFRDVPALRDLVTLPQAFSRAGYRTLSGGKVYHGSYPPPADRASEFDSYGPRPTFGPRPAVKFVNTPDEAPLMDWGVFPESDEEQNDYEIASWAVDEVTAATDPKQPFFLAVGFCHPHVPLYASQKWFDLYPEETLQMPLVLRGDRDDTPRFSWYLHWKLPEPRLKWLEENHQWRPLVRAYLASVSFMDNQVGRLLDALERTGQLDNTIIVFWGDHGWHLGEKEISGKNTLWERSTRVPLIIAGPGVARGTSSGPVELLDIYPSLIELCGLETPEGLEGHSLGPQLRDPAALREFPAVTTHNPGNHTVRTNDWRYIRYADGSEELYETAVDPEEWHNLASEPDRAALKKELARWLPETSAPPVPGSRFRVLTYNNGVAKWEGEYIAPDEDVPDDD